MRNREPLAHLEKACNKEQTMEDHLQGVAKLAREFAEEFGNGDWAEQAGFWHDLGKYNPKWQEYLRKSPEHYYKDENNKEGEIDKKKKEETDEKKKKTLKGPDHSTAGALHAVEKLNQVGHFLAYIISGHHMGLPDWSYDEAKGRSLIERLVKDQEKLKSALGGNPPNDILNPFLSSFSKPSVLNEESSEFLHLWIRMLFSCIVDADRLNTEAFMNPEKSEARGRYPEMSELKESYDAYMKNKQKEALKDPVNETNKQIMEKLQEILAQCLAKAQEPPGVFSLTVPTGGGKTLASMGFALEHALKHGKKRIIVVIPYTSIIEQTAKQMRDVFGENSVLEHHCSLDPEKETIISKLATENWDAPIIVTTSVQFFESLFSSNASACRKIHNITNSVVILDEVQTLPTNLLDPIVSCMKGLSRHFQTTFVLCTATQPVLNEEIQSGRASLKGFDFVEEIMSDPVSLYSQFQRVSISREHGNNIPISTPDSIAEQIVQYPQVLCIVSTRNLCKKLFELVRQKSQDNVQILHLSALMCPMHRSDVIAQIKEKLRNKEPIRVISTQVVEAGVDIDFPVVFRELAGLDSIAQAAGRCNRKGKLPEKGKVFVFNAGPVPQGQFTKARYACMETFRNITPGEELSPESFKKYFRFFFARLNSFDSENIQRLLTRDAQEAKIQFKTAGMKFKMIDDSNQHAIIVRYKSENKPEADSNPLIEELKKNRPDRSIMRKLQRFSVTLYKSGFESLKKKNAIKSISGIWVQDDEKAYDPVCGLDVVSDEDENSLTRKDKNGK